MPKEIIRPADLPSKAHAERVLLPLALAIRDELAGRFPEYAERLRSLVFCVNPRLTRTLGRAQTKGHTVELSRVLAVPENEDHRSTTIRHELGHMVLPPGTGHGRPWKLLAPLFGYPPEATTDRLMVSARRPRRGYFHTCKRCGADEVFLSRTQSDNHVRMQTPEPGRLHGYYHRCRRGVHGLLSIERREVEV